MAFVIGGVVILAFLIGALLSSGEPLGWGAAAILTLVPVILMRPYLFFPVFIVARPVLDIFARQRLMGSFNFAAVMTLAWLVVGMGLLARRDFLRALRRNKTLLVLDLVFCGYLFFCLSSFLHTRETMVSFSDLTRLLSLVVSFNYAAFYFSRPAQVKKMAFLIVFSAIIPLGVGFLQIATGTGELELGFRRIFGTFLHPNVFAEYLVLIFFCVLYLLGAGRLRVPARLALMGVLGLAVAALVFTFTRGAWLALFVSFAVFVFFKTSLPRFFFFIIIALIILGCLFPFVQKRFADISGPSGEEMSSWEWRLQQWRRTVLRVGEYPWVGHGLGMYERDFRIMAHNDYLRIAYETGLMGLLWYVIFFVSLSVSALMRALRAQDPSVVLAQKTAGCLVLAYLAMSAADNLARSTVIGIAYLSMIGSLFNFSAEEAEVAPAAKKGGGS